MILASPGSDPGEARARAAVVIAVAGPASVAAAARASAEPYVLLLAPGARPLPGAFNGLSAALGTRERLADGFAPGVLGGAAHGDGTAHGGGTRRFGWMLAPAPTGPLPFEIVPVVAEAGTDARVRGAIDVVAPGMVLAVRELLLEPLPADPVAAMIELCARARAAGRDIVCRPSFTCEIASDVAAFGAATPGGATSGAMMTDADDRGRAAALRALAEARPELRGVHRLPADSRRAFVERVVRLPGGRRERALSAMPAVTVLVHGAGAELAARRARDLAPSCKARAVGEPAAALRAEMRIRGDRYVLVARAACVPDAEAFAALVEAVESSRFVALAAPNAAALNGDCVLIALSRYPQHVEADGATIADAVESLVIAARTLRRAVRAPGTMRRADCAPDREAASGVVAHDVVAADRGAALPTATIVFAAASLPEVLRLTLTAVVEASRGGDELVAVCAATAATTRRIVASYPQVRVVDDAVDPLLADAINRVIGAAAGELVVLVADDVLVPTGALDRMRAAFARVPALGAAFPAVPGACGDEGVVDVQYADIASMRGIAEQRALDRAREAEPIDLAVSPVVAVARDAFAAVGGIDPAHGPTRRGLADLVLRLRAAGYAVVRCDDALVHRFDAALSHNPAAAADLQQPVPTADPAAIARGFDPARRVPFERRGTVTQPEPQASPAAQLAHAIAIPVSGPAELERAAIFLAAAARAFDASSRVRVHLLLDGTVAPADAVARVRPVLAASGKAMDDTLAVRVERVADFALWRNAAEPNARIVVAAGHERPALSGLRSIAAHALAASVSRAPEPVVKASLEPVAR